MRKPKKQITFPCMDVQMVDASKVVANDYNPNSVATPEMELLAISMEENGVAYACVTIYAPEIDRYILIDGFHRYTIMVHWWKLEQIPIIVLQKDMAERILATVQFNRARGKHMTDLMAELVTKLLRLGMDDIAIATYLGMEAEEVLRLKQTTGLAEMFANQPFGRAWVRDAEEAGMYLGNKGSGKG